MSSGKTANTTSIDLQHGDRDHITPSVSMSLTPETPRSKAAMPTPRRSFEVEEGLPRHQTHQGSRVWRTLEAKLPAPVTKWNGKLVGWFKGPEPPTRYRIKPIFERIQTLPVRLLARLPRWVRVCIYAAGCLLWAALFGVIISNYSLPENFAGFGTPFPLSCVANLWPGAQLCGLDGRNCLPFANASFAFNCPADCLGVKVLNPKAIGNTSINYRSLVVGGALDGDEGDPHVYRGDSFLCGAAIHAGAITNNQGGCGVVSLIGQRTNFPAQSRNGINSVGFDSSFPLAFDFLSSAAISSESKKCRDPRWNLLILSTIFSALFGLLTSRPATFFAPVFTILFFQIGMASDTPGYSDYPSLASTILARFLPAALCAALFYQFSVRKTLHKCVAPVEKTVLWVGAAWVGALSNYTLDKIPISRLTGHDIKQQPGAVTALVVIVLILFAVILYQCWCLRKEGRLPRFLALYAVFGIGLGVLSALPHLTLRIHHYILALLLLPGTSTQTRVSLVAQGLLVGLFVNGIARWDFASVVETQAALRGDAQLGSVVPRILEPIINDANITFVWEAVVKGWMGVSVIVNDVERFRGTGQERNFTWSRKEGEKEYFRFGYVNYGPLSGVTYSDFTSAGTWWANGSWSGIPAGRT